MDLSEWWNHIYDQWLIEGDLSILLHLQKIERYLQKGRVKSHQETINLMAQCEGLLELKYHGKYRYLPHRKLDLLLVIKCLQPYPPLNTIDLPKYDDIDGLCSFMQNSNNIQIKPQNIGTIDLDIHPCWILWSHLYNYKTRSELWAYRMLFIRYMIDKNYRNAGRTYQHAYRIKARCDLLPILHPYVIEKVMYSNIDYQLRTREPRSFD